MTEQQQGTKFDQGKLRLDLISPYAEEGLASVLTFGANKYNDRNWEKGILYSRVFAAARRHMRSWWKGEDLDPETGLSHIDHAQACLHFLSHYVKGDYSEFDDRPQ
jgi:hypothetical protein